MGHCAGGARKGSASPIRERMGFGRHGGASYLLRRHQPKGPLAKRAKALP
jgi:hypothetical protein